MKLFKSKEKGCCNFTTDSIKNNEHQARIKVLGSGCKKCNTLEENVKEALKRLEKQQPIAHVSDFGEIASYGVMSTPALMVDDKVLAFGRVVSIEECMTLLKDVL